MREWAKFVAGFWTSSSIQSLSDSAKLLAAYLISGPHSNQAGVFRMPDGYVMADLGWDAERVSKGFAELSAKGFANRCETTFWVVVTKALKHTPPENPNQAKHVRALIEQMPDTATIKPLVLQAVTEFWRAAPAELMEALKKPFDNPSTTLSKQREGEREREGEEKEREKERGGPLVAARRSPADTTAVWESYASTYKTRYHVDPVRNAKVNGQLKQLLQRLPAEEAPAVAAFYVGHNRGLYVSAKHPVDLLLRDCEGLRTEWASGNTVTETAARQADRTATNQGVFGKLIEEARAQEEYRDAGTTE
jgi:hypothetical protein